MKNFLAAFAASISLSHAVLAQDKCSDILQNGIFEILETQKSTEVYSQMGLVIEGSIEQIRETSKQGNGAAKVAIGVLKFAGEGGGAQQRIEELRSAWKQGEEQFFKSNEYTSLRQVTVSDKIVDAWLECTKLRFNRTFQPLSHSIEGDPASSFTLALTYDDPTNKIPSINLASSYLDNLTLKTQDAPLNPLKEGIQRLVFERVDRTKPAHLLYAYGEFGYAEYHFNPVAADTVSVPNPYETLVVFPEDTLLLQGLLHMIRAPFVDGRNRTIFHKGTSTIVFTATLTFVETSPRKFTPYIYVYAMAEDVDSRRENTFAGPVQVGLYNEQALEQIRIKRQDRTIYLGTFRASFGENQLPSSYSGEPYFTPEDRAKQIDFNYRSNDGNEFRLFTKEISIRYQEAD